MQSTATTYRKEGESGGLDADECEDQKDQTSGWVEEGAQIGMTELMIF